MSRIRTHACAHQYNLDAPACTLPTCRQHDSPALYDAASDGCLPPEVATSTGRVASVPSLQRAPMGSPLEHTCIAGATGPLLPFLSFCDTTHRWWVLALPASLTVTAR